MADKIDGGRVVNTLPADDELLQLENEKFRAGFRFVVGIDEVGRGPLAGPVVAAAVGSAGWAPQAARPKSRTNANRKARSFFMVFPSVF